MDADNNAMNIPRLEKNQLWGKYNKSWVFFVLFRKNAALSAESPVIEITSSCREI